MHSCTCLGNMIVTILLMLAGLLFFLAGFFLNRRELGIVSKFSINLKAITDCYPFSDVNFKKTVLRLHVSNYWIEYEATLLCRLL